MEAIVYGGNCLWRLHFILPRSANITLHFTKKLESILYNAVLAITGAIRGTSKDKLYNKLGLETLEKGNKKLCCFFEIFQISMFKVHIQYYSGFCEYPKHKKY